MAVHAAEVREDARDGKTVGQVREHLGRGQQGQRRLALAQHQEAGDVVDLRVDQQHGGDAAVADGAGRLQLGVVADLGQDVGRGVDQQPVAAVGTDRDGRLRARTRLERAAAKAVTVGAVAVPLREAPTGGRSENPYAHVSSPWKGTKKAHVWFTRAPRSHQPAPLSGWRCTS